MKKIIIFAIMAILISLSAITVNAAIDIQKFDYELKDLKYSYNDSGNDNGLVIYAKEKTTQCGITECKFYIELENTSEYVLNDITLGIYFRGEQKNKLTIKEINYWGTVSEPTTQMVKYNCDPKDITKVPTLDLNTDYEKYFCATNLRPCQSSTECYWEKLETTNKEVTGWHRLNPTKLANITKDSGISSDFDIHTKYAGFRLSPRERKKYQIVVKKPKDLKSGEYIISAKSSSLSQFFSILDPWFDTNYPYKKQFVYTNSNTVVDIYNATLDFNLTDDTGNVNDSCLGITVTNASEDTELDFNRVEANASWCHLRIDLNVNANSTFTYYVYYGNGTVDNSVAIDLNWAKRPSGHNRLDGNAIDEENVSDSLFLANNINSSEAMSVRGVSFYMVDNVGQAGDSNATVKFYNTSDGRTPTTEIGSSSEIITMLDVNSWHTWNFDQNIWISADTNYFVSIEGRGVNQARQKREFQDGGLSNITWPHCSSNSADGGSTWNNASCNIIYIFNLYREVEGFVTEGSEELAPTNIAPDINILAPLGNQYLGGDVNISFSVQDDDLGSAADGDLLVDIYYSTVANTFENLIAADVNLMSNNGCDDTNFMLTPTNCFFNWDTDGNSIADGNYFIDLNISDDSDSNAISSSTASFFLDNSIPDIFILAPPADGIGSSTTITFDVNENSLISSATVTINGVTSTDFTFGTDCTKFDINYHCSYSESSLVANNDNNISILATNTIGDTNQSDLNYILNNAPSITIQAPDGNQYIGGNDINISFRVTDSDLNGNIIDGLFVDLFYSTTSGGFTTQIVDDLNLFEAASCDTNDFSGGVNCSFLWNSDLNNVADGNYFIDANVFDRYDFNAQDSSGASFFLDNSAPDIYITRPTQGSTVESRQIDFNVMENGMVNTITTLINGNVSAVFSQGTHCTLFDINYVCSYVEDDVVSGDNNITIRATNTGGGNDQNEFSVTFTFNNPEIGGGGAGGGGAPAPPAPEKRFEVVSIPETINATRNLSTEFKVLVKNVSNVELTNFEIRFNEEIAPMINSMSVPEIIGAGEIQEFVYRITPREDTESQTIVVFFFDGAFADSQEISLVVIDSVLASIIVLLNSPAFNFGESVINWNILLFAILAFSFLLFINPLPKQLISVKIISLIVLGLLLVSVVVGV